MEFWVAVFGWIVMGAYIYSMFAKPEWHFSFDYHVPRSAELNHWWLRKGLPEWLFIAIRTIVIFVIMVLFLRMTIRMYSNA